MSGKRRVFIVKETHERRTSNIDGFVKSLKTSPDVIPAKAGIQ